MACSVSNPSQHSCAGDVAHAFRPNNTCSDSPFVAALLKTARSSCLPDCPARLLNSWGHVAPAERGLLPDPLANSFLLHGAALAASGEGEMFSVCLEERQTLLRLLVWVSSLADLFSALEG